MRFGFICFLFISFAVSGQQNTPAKNPTYYLENFDFKAIDYTSLDSTSRDYINAIEHSLYHRFGAAESLLKKVALQTGSPLSKAARHYLLNELYFWRGKYADYVAFSDSINEKNGEYKLAKLLASYPEVKTRFTADSVLLPVTVRKGGYVIADVLLNGKPVRLILDSGASFSVIPQKLSDELSVKYMADMTILNAVGTTIPAHVGVLDSLSMGNIHVNNVPVIYTEKSRFLKQQRVDGLLGWDILRKFSYTTDFNAQTLTIRKPVTDSAAEKNLFGIGFPLMAVQTESGNQLNMFFDSGSNSVDLMANGVTKLSDHKTIRRLKAITGIGKTKIGLFHYVKNVTFKVNQTPLTCERAYLSPLNDWLTLNIRRDGILSNVPFRKGKLTVDYINNHFDYRE